MHILKRHTHAVTCRTTVELHLNNIKRIIQKWKYAKNVDNAIRMRVPTADKNIHTTQVCWKQRNPLRHFNWKKYP